ncbi:hypothetical protein HYZ76_00965 [Candidatus Falkowbacteria bacterium]|nr:hypothetical protein [Candidatus Falkowbacteria bacterium]
MKKAKGGYMPPENRESQNNKKGRDDDRQKKPPVMVELSVSSDSPGEVLPGKPPIYRWSGWDRITIEDKRSEVVKSAEKLLAEKRGLPTLLGAKKLLGRDGQDPSILDSAIKEKEASIADAFENLNHEISKPAVVAVSSYSHQITVALSEASSDEPAKLMLRCHQWAWPENLGSKGILVLGSVNAGKEKQGFGQYASSFPKGTISYVVISGADDPVEIATIVRSSRRPDIIAALDIRAGTQLKVEERLYRHGETATDKDVSELGEHFNAIRVQVSAKAVAFEEPVETPEEEGADEKSAAQ